MDSVTDDVLVVLDEAYAEICLGDMPDSVSLVKRCPNVLVTRTFSKAYGLAGLRLGYGLAGAELAEALQKARQPFNVNLLAQVAGLAALDDTAFVKDARAVYAQAKADLEAGCRGLGVNYVPGFGNFMLIEVGDGGACVDYMQSKGVIIRPLGVYQLPTYIRVTFGRPEENQRFLQVLRDYLSESA